MREDNHIVLFLIHCSCVRGVCRIFLGLIGYLHCDSLLYCFKLMGYGINNVVLIYLLTKTLLFVLIFVSFFFSGKSIRLSDYVCMVKIRWTLKKIF